jgi:hypothetical protein
MKRIELSSFAKHGFLALNVDGCLNTTAEECQLHLGTVMGGNLVCLAREAEGYR